MATRVGHLLVSLGQCKEHKDCARSSEDREEPEYPTPVYSRNSHKTCDQGSNLPSTVSEGIHIER